MLWIDTERPCIWKIGRMRFELEPYHRNVSKAEIRDDIRRVADALQKTAITAADYRQHGRFSPDLARRRFGSWFKALAAAGLGKTRNLALSAEECISDLKEVARLLGKNAVTRQEYAEHGKYSPGPFIRHFGSWFKALDCAGLERTRTWGVADEDYFENLEDMWVKLGRQPHYSDVQKPFSLYSAGAYERRFGSWRKALEAFVRYVNDEACEDSPSVPEQTPTPPAASVDRRASAIYKDSGSISWRLRFLVMRRDSFRCRICGRSPAAQPGLVLHVDHVHPRNKGGQTVMENLQTLCEQCNIGKSDLSMEEQEKA